MTALRELASALAGGAVTVVDLTAPLDEDTPIIALPSDHAQPWPFSRDLISEYDAGGADVYWNNIRLSEHTGTHFDAPVHWRSGKDLADVSQVPADRLVAPAAVLDFSAEAERDPDFLLTREHVEEWVSAHGPLPEGGWLLYRTGWDARGADADRFRNAGHTPGIEPACARWLAEQTALTGLGVETVGTDAGQAASLDPPFPCHWYFQGAGKYGLTQLRNLARLPAQGAVLIAGPLPIVRGSGSPARVLALVDAEPAPAGGPAARRT
jgi:kynurenine formamidase